MRWAFPVALAAFLAAACGGKDGPPRGPGLPACSRDVAVPGCTVTWSGSDSGTSSCSDFVTASTSSWNFWLNGGSTSSLSVAVELTSTPSVGQSFTLDQTAGASILLTRDQNISWIMNKSSPPAATPGIMGDLLLRVDEVVPGSGDIHGSLAASLVPNGSAPGPGVALCATF